MEIISGYILAGGKSSRMGSDKGLLQARDKSLIEYVLKVVDRFCEEVYIISGNTQYDQFKKPLLMDDIPNKGPIGGIYTALKHSRTPWNLIVACDMPEINETIIQRLIEHITNDVDCIVFKINKRFEPLCALYHKSAMNVLWTRIQNDKLSMQEAIKNMRAHTVEVAGLEGNSFFNVNTKEDLKQFVKKQSDGR